MFWGVGWRVQALGRVWSCSLTNHVSHITFHLDVCLYEVGFGPGHILGDGLLEVVPSFKVASWICFSFSCRLDM